VTRVSADNFTRALEALQRATERDAGYGLARAFLAGQCANAHALGFSIPVERPLDPALALARKALALDPDRQRVRWNLAHVLCHRHDVDECLAEIERSIGRNPDNATLLGQSSWRLAWCGRWERRLEILDRSTRLNPYHPPGFCLAHYLDGYRRGEHEGALAYARRIDLTPVF